MYDPVVIFLAWLIVPVLPAYAMFKWLPSDTSATGPFGGLKWKLGGAFAGYFLLVLVSMSYVSDLKEAALEEQKAKLEATRAGLGEPWTITGHIKKADGSIPLEAKFLTQPPILDIRDDGGFSVSVLLPRRKPGDVMPPDLIIKCDGFLSVGLPLPWDDETKGKQPPGKYSASPNPETHVISIEPTIILEPLPVTDKGP